MIVVIGLLHIDLAVDLMFSVIIVRRTWYYACLSSHLTLRLLGQSSWRITLSRAQVNTLSMLRSVFPNGGL